MKPFEKILLPTDFSPGAEAALKTAIALAKTYGSEIIPLHAISIDNLFKAVNRDALKAQVTTKLKTIEDNILGEGVQVRQALVELGNPFELIVQQADFLDANLVLMGAKGTEDEAKYRIGITVQKVMRQARKPVWAVEQEAAVPPQTILCAVDFSGPSHHALANAADLARHLKAELTVLHVIQPLSRLDVGAGWLGDQARAKYEREQRQEFEAFFKRVDIHDIRCIKEVRLGKPHEEILNLARKMEADLLVMGSEGQTAMVRFFMGSVAERVTRDLPCSVITLKREGVIQPQVDGQMSDVEKRFHAGLECLKEGKPVEAMRHYDYCLSQDMMFLPAWEGVSEAQAHLGNGFLAQEYKKQAEAVREQIRQRQVQARRDAEKG